MKIACLLTAVTLLACEKRDVGNPCPQLGAEAGANNNGEGRAETQQLVAQDVTFPCDELICIATDGLAGYCSKKCREDAGCPTGFECREVQPVGVFAGKKFCAWKRCSAAADCGNLDDFCCTAVPNAGPVGDLLVCSFKDDTCG